MKKSYCISSRRALLVLVSISGLFLVSPAFAQQAGPIPTEITKRFDGCNDCVDLIAKLKKNKHWADAIKDIQATADFKALIATPKRIPYRNENTLAAYIEIVKDRRAFDVLVSVLAKDKSVSLRAAAAVYLGVTQDPQAYDPLAAALLNDKAHEVREEAAESLGEITDPRVVEPLIRAFMSDPESDVRTSAAVSLGNLKDPRAVEPLIAILNIETYSDLTGTQIAAINALGNLRDPRAVEPLGKVLENDEFYTDVISDALAKIKNRQAAEVLIVALHARRPIAVVTEKKLIATLQEIGEPAVEPLVAAMSDPDADVRMDATEALAVSNTPRAHDVISARMGELYNISRNYRSIIAQGKKGTEDSLIDALNQYGNPQMALDYIVCHNSKLEDAGEDWAGRNGYKVESTTGYGGGDSTTWGSGR